ncbi:MAG: DNA alkylation repair protein [Clostridia bacterium]|nr:DNA alkylation repair protein [Clostridia bacterium]
MENEIKQRLMELSDAKYRQFHSSLCPETENILGVRVPILRRYAKELYKEHKIAILNEIGNDYYEEILLQGLVIGEQTSVKSIIKCLTEFVPKIDNWAICDTTCAALKIIRRNKKEFVNFIKKCLNSGEEFQIRFGLVLLLDYFIDEEYIDEVLALSNEVKHEGYYARMANAWLLSICLVKYYDKTITFLKKSNLDDFTYNKALQKAIESYRITDEQKAELRKMKRK